MVMSAVAHNLTVANQVMALPSNNNNMMQTGIPSVRMVIADSAQLSSGVPAAGFSGTKLEEAYSAL